MRGTNMSNRFTKTNYDNIQKNFAEGTGIEPDKKYNYSKCALPARTVITICICLSLACGSVFATEQGQALIKKLLFNKPVASETISFGYEEPSIVEIPVDNSDENKTADETQTITRPGHKGLDIVCDKGTPVYPVLEGNVIDTGYNSSYGNYILIQHQDGYASKYAHLESILVEPGQDVSIETQIGTVGSTGMSTGPHLHLEMTYNDELIDPSPFVLISNSDTTPTD